MIPEQKSKLDPSLMSPPVDNKALVLETVHQIALDILAHRTGVEALRHIADVARALAGARYAALGVARPGKKGLQDFVTVGMTDDEEAAIGARPKGVGILRLLLERMEPLRIDSLGSHAASAGFPPNHPPMNSFLGVPIRRGDIVLGSLYLTEKIDGSLFTEADEMAVQALGAHAAVAIHTMQMLARQRALVSGLIHAQEEERRAVAYDLHDGLTQYVMASHAHLEAFRRASAAGKTEKAERELDQGLHCLKEAVVESRRLVNGLRTLALDDLGLAGALEQMLAEEKARASWTDADLAHNIAGERFDKTLETAVYRVAQEALTNARKHSQTQRVRVLLLEEQNSRKDGRQLTLEVRDWGCGFDPKQSVEASEHVGMQSMIERVRLLDGDYEVRSKLGDGSVIHAVFPVLALPEEKETAA
jgi:signal transduction histidine kinase